jgi:hypothetical protein
LGDAVIAAVVAADAVFAMEPSAILAEPKIAETILAKMLIVASLQWTAIGGASEIAVKTG